MIESYTARFHIRAVAGQGAVTGVFLFNEYVLLRELGASRWHVLALMLAPALAQLSAVVWNPAAPGHLLGTRPFRTLGIALHGSLLLLLVPAFQRPVAFVVVLGLCLVGQALLIPLQNVILTHNYADARRSRRFGTAVSVQALLIVTVSLPVGWLLDAHHDIWPWLYVFAAGAAGLAFLQWARLRRRRPKPPPPDLVSFPSAWKALWGDKQFLAFEACFMAYGLGFLALQPVLPIYLVDELHVGYAEVGLARGALFWIVMVVCGLAAGRLGERVGILRLGALGFLLLAVFAATLVALPTVTGMMIGFGVFGAAMSCVNVAWNLGPILLARGRDPLPYLNAHIGLVGVRALLGMSAGTIAQHAFGSATVFVSVAVLEVLAAVALLVTATASGRRWRAPGPQPIDVSPGRPPR